jgi:hypothetical protein
MTVGAHIKRVKVYEVNFARYYGLELNHKQSKGSAWDCLIPGTDEKIEFKSDFMAAKTGNHFVEFRYSNCDGESWDESGITLAKDQAQWWVVYYGINPDEYCWYRPESLLALVESLKPPIKGIRRNLYGNKGSVKCEGYIIPLTEMLKIQVREPLPPARLEQDEELF